MVGSLARQRMVAVLIAAAAVIALLPVAPVAAAADEEPVRLLVTYAQPVEADDAAAVVRTAAVAAETDEPSAVQVLEFDRSVDAQTAVRRLLDDPAVVAVEPDGLLTVADPTSPTVVAQLDTTGSSLAAASAASTASETPASWGVRNDGQRVADVAGRRGIDVGASLAWPHATGRNVVVAVIDSGVDTSHPLLRDRMWVNPRERADGQDTDGNGYRDDIHGWNFVDDSPQVFVSPSADSHGTHVAGIIAGTAHAASGFQSVAPDARIMALRFIDGDAGRTSDAIAAIRYAQANGADVINASWSGPEPSSALRAAIAELTIPFVAAAGNNGGTPTYPTSYGLPNVISVAALDNTGALAPYSARSRTLVDVAAPGSRILSTYPGSRLAEASGTSQAAPHVSGVLALALQRHPNATPEQLKAAVRDSVRPLASAAETGAGGLARAPALLDLLGTRVPACASIDRVPFGDVSVGGAHHDAVACMLARGVTRGTSATTYGSGDGLTRAQIATMLANALAPTGELPAPPAVGRYGDVGDSVHRDNIEVLGQLGIVRGTTATRFDPSAIVTRAEFAATVVRAGEWLAGAEVRVAGQAFDDTVSHVEVAAIGKAAGLRIVTGRAPGVFDPDVPLRRDQAASMVTRLLDRLVQQGLLDAS